jgi:hypothetical protein
MYICSLYIYFYYCRVASIQLPIHLNTSVLCLLSIPMLAYLNSICAGGPFVLIPHYSPSMQTHVSAFALITFRLVYNAFVTMVIMVMPHLLLLVFTFKASLQYVYHWSGHSLYLYSYMILHQCIPYILYH